VSYQTFRQIVDDGFSFNGNSFEITDNFWTPFEEQEIKIGKPNTFTAKVYAEKQLRSLNMIFGIPLVGESHKAELEIESLIDYDGTITEIIVNQKTNVIDESTLKVNIEKVKCQESDKTERCDLITVTATFLEPLQDKVMALQAIDYKNRYTITHLNDGFNITGDSLNPMHTDMAYGTVKYEGLIEVTQLSKYSDIWIAADGREFQRNDYGSFVLINQVIDHGEVNNRLKNIRVSAENDRALIIANDICPKCYDEPFDKLYDTFAYEILDLLDRDDPEYQRLLNLEAYKAKQLLDKLN